jgi:hypothetical protein
MDLNSGIVRDNFDPTKHNGVPIPAEWVETARNLAENGIPLHDIRNQCAKLREWALRQMEGHRPKAPTEAEFKAAERDRWEGFRPGPHARMQEMQNQKNNRQRAEKKRLRKLQKQRKVR